ncbi:MAG: murein biosynthesis integral membrane protein MurJ [Candidatus Omnitrophica bacterium]|nr:murein biosynthesis integral membrane protein MurJ [Candidatus Omnitrophota bacterium]
MSFKSIRKSFFILTGATILCRIFGLFREIATANYFGTTGIYDSFLLAFMIPNFFRGLLAEGALSTAFIPVLTEYLTDPEKKGEVKKISSKVFTFFLVSTITLYVIFIVLSFSVVHSHLFSPKVDEIFELLKFTFPYLIFVSLAAWCMGILNSYNHFLVPGLSPVIFDGWWILSLFVFVPFFKTFDAKIYGLIIGVILGGIGQFLFQFPKVVKYQGFPKLDFDWGHPALKKMLFLFTPIIIGVSVGPINLLVDYSFANFLKPGMVSALWYATRIYQLPLGVFSVSMATILLPQLSKDAIKKNVHLVRENMEHGVSQIFFLMIPSSIWLALYRNSLITLFFKHGAFNGYSVQITAFALLFFSLGIVFYGAAMVLTNTFYAFNDTRTPVKIGLISIATNAVLDYVLMQFLSQGGIALSTSFVGLENFLFLGYILNKKFNIFSWKYITKSFLRILAVSLLWGILLWLVKRFFNLGPDKNIIIGLVLGFLLYIGLSFILKLPEAEGWKKRGNRDDKIRESM